MKVEEQRKTVPGETSTVAVLCLNPAVDMTYEIDRLIANEKVHAKSSRFDPGGNGINVGRALKRLKLPAATFCVVAGEIGRLLQRMLVTGLDDPRYIEVAGETRINGTVLERQPEAQYEVSGIGPEILTDQLAALTDRFVDAVGTGWALLTGSLQPSIPIGIYGDIARRVRARGGRVIVDAHDEMLRQAIQAEPFLIKPNRFELENLLGRTLPGLDAVAEEARAIQAAGVDNVCVSLGEEGALLVNGSGAYHGRPPRVAANSTVGAGDSMVAGLTAALVRGESPEVALRDAIACSVGTVMQPGTQLFAVEDLERLRERVTVRRL